MDEYFCELTSQAMISLLLTLLNPILEKSYETIEDGRTLSVYSYPWFEHTLDLTQNRKIFVSFFGHCRSERTSKKPEAEAPRIYSPIADQTVALR